ncbi:MAG TPA: glycosyltransferase [Actinomycetota bacterium]
MVDLSLVVPTYARAERIDQLAERLRSLGDPPQEIIVVAGDPASARRAARQDLPGLRVLEVENRNAGSSRNAGWRAASSTLVAFLDDDCLPGPAWAKAVRAAMKDGTAGAAGGPVSNAGARGLLGRVAQTWLDRRYDPGDAPWLASQNLVVRRQVLEATGGFDEALATYEDVDLSFRIRAAGSRLVRDPEMVVEHRHRDTLRGFLRQHHGYGRGFTAIARKHPDWDQASRAPLTRIGRARALALALGRPFACAAGMERATDRVASLPLFALREAAFLAGALREARA